MTASRINVMNNVSPDGRTDELTETITMSPSPSAGNVNIEPRHAKRTF